jgi:hypothetical protein
MEAVYRLCQMVGRMAHIAEVGVRIEEADQDEVIVSPDAFIWRREVYGPNAVINANNDHLLVAEAVDGVHRALDNLAVRSAGYQVTLTKIQETPVDTWPGDILVAAANAVSQALRVQLDPPIRAGTTEADPLR